MKKIILSLAVAMMAAVGANAQNFDKGDLSLGVDLGYRATFADPMISAFTVGGAAAYYFNDQFAIDGKLNLALGKNSYKSVFGEIGARYYCMEYLFARVAYAGELPNRKNFHSGASIGVGYDWFLSSNLFVEPSVNYNYGFNRKNGALTVSATLGYKF